VHELKDVMDEDVYNDARLYAIENTAPPPHTREMMLGMRKRNAVLAAMTFGFEDILRPWYRYRISVPAYLYGTRLVFHKKRLVGYDRRWEYGKVSYAQFLAKKLGFEPYRIIAVDDDPVIDRTIAALLGVDSILWLDDDEARAELTAKGLYTYPGKSSVVLRGVKKDMRVLTTYVDEIRRGFRKPSAAAE
jgi:hypothetical protein